MGPNFIVVLVDAARADHLSAYGYDRETMPFLAEIAERATVYENAYSNSIWSLPAYASLFTGCYPSDHGAVDWGRSIQRNKLVESLSAAGYETGAVSPHLVSGEFGIADAFDVTNWVEDSDLLFKSDPVVERVREKRQEGGWASATAKYRDVALWTLCERSLATVPNAAYYLYQALRQRLGFWGDDGAAEVVDRGLEFVENASEPWFLFMNFIETHGPYLPPPGYVDRFTDDDWSPAEIRRLADCSTTALSAGEIQLDGRERELLIALYDAEMAYLDDQLRRFYEAFARTCPDGNSVFVFLADHGDLFGEAGFWGHQGVVHPKLCHVPLVIEYPWESEEVVTDTVELSGLAGHLRELADGRRELLATDDRAVIEYYGWDTQLLIDPWETYDEVEEAVATRYQAAIARDGRFLVVDSDGEEWFYEDGVRSDGDPPVDLRALLDEELGDPATTRDQYRTEAGEDPKVSDDVRHRLADLGYVD